jgi:hypothetical protein
VVVAQVVLMDMVYVLVVHMAVVVPVVLAAYMELVL